MRVLLVSGIDGFCHRYQVLHRARQIAHLGGAATVRHFADPRLPGEAPDHDLVFLYRVPETAHVVAAIDAARAAGRRVLGSIDDLIFVPDERLFPEIEAWSADERDLWMQGLRRYRATLERCDAAVVPTEALVAEAEAAGLRPLLHRNSVSVPECTLARDARARARGRRSTRDGGDVRIGYFSGTPTHDRDLAAIAPALADVLRAHPATRLVLHGPVAPGPALAALGERVERRPLVPWWDLAAAVAACDVSLAPLETGRRFAAAKGEIKYLEAALVGVPTVASPTPAFRHAIRDRENGRLAATPEAWRDALAELVADAALRHRLGAAALEDVGSRFGEAARARELAHVLETARGLGPRAAHATRALVSRPEEEPRPARAALEPDAAPALACMDDAGEGLCRLGEGARVTRTLAPVAGGLVRVDVHTVTEGRTLDGMVELELCERGAEPAGADAIVCRAAIPAREVPDRGWLALELPRPRSTAGRTFTLTIAHAGPGPAGLLALSLAAAGAAAAGRTGADAKLALRAWAPWPRTGADGAR